MLPIFPYYRCYFDGACEPRNPGGNMGMGFVITGINGIVLHEHSMYVKADPRNSNNVAEYKALNALLSYLRTNLDHSKDHAVDIYGDSMLVIMQMSGKWEMKGGRYVPYAMDAKDSLRILRNRKVTCKLEWIPRHKNALADEMSKRELKKYGVKLVLQKQ